MIALKPIYGGSIPSFLVMSFEFARMRALRKCGREEGSREATLR